MLLSFVFSFYYDSRKVHSLLITGLHYQHSFAFIHTHPLWGASFCLNFLFSKAGLLGQSPTDFACHTQLYLVPFLKDIFY